MKGEILRNEICKGKKMEREEEALSLFQLSLWGKEVLCCEVFL